jgi:two-component system LytT family sensor kinase
VTAAPGRGPSPARRRVERWIIAVGALLPGVTTVVQATGAPLPGGRVITLGQAAAAGTMNSAYWAVSLYVAFWFARRFPMGRGHNLRNGAIHLGVAVARGVLSAPLDLLGSRYILDVPAPPLGPLLVRSVYNEGVLYLLVLGVIHAVQYYEGLRQRELEAVRLQGSLAEARLQALKTQLNPHFLFNALNSVSTLMHRDVDAAERVLARLSDLLRMSLQDRDAQEVPLRRELELLDPYLEIERTRFPDRLEVERRIDPAVLELHVPHLILQPLVENAVRHGIAPRAGPGRVEVAAERVDGTLRLVVRDDGVGMGAPGNGRGTGVGLSNTRARLQALYGEAHTFVVEPAPGGGTRVTVSIPVRENPGSVVEADAEKER